MAARKIKLAPALPTETNPRRRSRRHPKRRRNPQPTNEQIRTIIVFGTGLGILSGVGATAAAKTSLNEGHTARGLLYGGIAGAAVGALLSGVLLAI